MYQNTRLYFLPKHILTKEEVVLYFSLCNYIMNLSFNYFNLGDTALFGEHTIVLASFNANLRWLQRSELV